jgi:cell division protein FtsB
MLTIPFATWYKENKAALDAKNIDERTAAARYEAYSKGGGTSVADQVLKSVLGSTVQATDTLDSLRGQIAKLTADNEKLTADLTAANEEIAKLTADNEKLTADLTAANEEIAKLKTPA